MNSDNEKGSAFGILLVNLPISLLVAAVSVQYYADNISHDNYTLLRIAFCVIFIVCFAGGLFLCLLLMALLSPSEENRPIYTPTNNTGSFSPNNTRPHSPRDSGPSSPSGSYDYSSVPPPNIFPNAKTNWEILEDRKAEQLKKDKQELDILENTLIWGRYHGLDKSDTFGVWHNTDEERAEELRRKIRGY